MKLIPKAKPVRIRVSSGGIEHSSLSTLRENFDYFKDILPLCEKGSIGKWLKQQNETEVLVKVNKAFNQDKSNDVNYNVNLILSFFPDVDNEDVKDYYDIIKIWAKKDYKKDIQYFLNGIKEKEVLINILVSLNKDDNGDEYVEKLIENRLNQIKPKREQKLVENKTKRNQISEPVGLESIEKLIEKYHKGSLNVDDYRRHSPKLIKDSASFLNLVLTIKRDVEGQCYAGTDYFKSNLTQTIFCDKDDWPKDLRKYVAYVMICYRKYADSFVIESLKTNYSERFHNKYGGFTHAITSFFWGEIGSYLETKEFSAKEILPLKKIISKNKTTLFEALDYIVDNYFEQLKSGAIEDYSWRTNI